MQYTEMDLTTLSRALAAGVMSSRQLVLAAMKVIAEKDSEFNAVLELNPDALFQADRADELRRSGIVLSPLQGIPVLIKDNISTKDGMHTSAGALALADNFASADSAVAEQLRKAGAVILGKTNMTEFANYVSGPMPNGYSSRGGQVKGVFPGVDPSGSSTGSAVAVASGYCPAAVGTETCGSIVGPASRAAIIGLKPTLGLVSRRGIIPICHTLDTAGPMTRTVRDAALLLAVLAGPDPDDPAVTDAPVPDYLSGLTGNLSGIRIGISRLPSYNASAEQVEVSERAVALLRERGAECVELLEESADSAARGVIMRYEFRRDLDRYLHEFSTGTCRTLDDVVAWNLAHSTAIPYGQDILQAALFKSGTLTEPEYFAALQKRQDEIERLDRVFDQNRVDVIIDVHGDCCRCALTGFPDITVPMGICPSGKPRDALLMARRFDETNLLRAAYALEQARGPLK